jgi:hypothetical protein
MFRRYMLFLKLSYHLLGEAARSLKSPNLGRPVATVPMISNQWRRTIDRERLDEPKSFPEVIRHMVRVVSFF